jgi:hypothetical protein
MKSQYLKALIIGLALSFGTQACAIWIGDHDHGYHQRDYDHHYRYQGEDGHGGEGNRHSSLEKPAQSMAQLANSEDSGSQRQAVPQNNF